MHYSSIGCCKRSLAKKLGVCFCVYLEIGKQSMLLTHTFSERSFRALQYGAKKTEEFENV